MDIVKIVLLLAAFGLAVIVAGSVLGKVQTEIGRAL